MNPLCIGVRRDGDVNGRKQRIAKNCEARDLLTGKGETRVSLNILFLLRHERCLGDHGPHKREAVSSFWERSQSLSSTWEWGQSEYRPHCMTSPMHVGWHDFNIQCWMVHGDSMVQISHAIWWTHEVNGEQLINLTYSSLIKG